MKQLNHESQFDRFNKKVQCAYIYQKIGNEQNQQELKTWIEKEKSQFLKYLDQCIKNKDKDNFYYFDLALSLNLSLENRNILSYLTESLSQKIDASHIGEAQEMVLIKSNLLKIGTHHFKFYNQVKTHFSNTENFEHYYSFFQEPYPINIKLILANALKEANPGLWKSKNWENVVYKEYKDFFLLPPHQKYSHENTAYYFYFRIWHLFSLKALEAKKILPFAESWLMNHLENLKNFIQKLEINYTQFEYMIPLISLCSHPKIYGTALRWLKKLENYIQAHSNDEISQELVKSINELIYTDSYLSF